MMSYEAKWLEGEPSEINDNDRIYDMAKIKEKFEVRDLCADGWLVLNRDPYPDSDSGWLRFAVLNFHCSNVDGGDLKCAMVFHGEGPYGTLREPRHFYFGESSNGYLFYPRASVIVAAFEALKEFYDFN